MSLEPEKLRAAKHERGDNKIETASFVFHVRMHEATCKYDNYKRRKSALAGCAGYVPPFGLVGSGLAL